mgnify:CR=1 FL=1
MALPMPREAPVTRATGRDEDSMAVTIRLYDADVDDHTETFL